MTSVVWLDTLDAGVTEFGYVPHAVQAAGMLPLVDTGIFSLPSTC